MGKTARVVEEAGLRREADRVTIVHKEEIEIEQLLGRESGMADVRVRRVPPIRRLPRD